MRALEFKAKNMTIKMMNSFNPFVPNEGVGMVHNEGGKAGTMPFQSFCAE